MPTELQARLSIVHFNLSFNGWGDGHGYPGLCPNPADTYLGRPCEYSCADGYTFACKHAGHRLPPFYPGIATGFAYVPWGEQYATAKHATRPSWRCEPADAVFINTGNGAQPGHVEMVEKLEGEQLYTFGWDSGPSNVDHYTGQGGCHRHVWHVPAGVGNPAIMTTMDLSKVVDLGTPTPTPKPAPPYDYKHPMLMLKSPWMGSPKGWPIIHEVQARLNRLIGSALLTDGVYGEKTDAAVRTFQHRRGLRQDGVVGPATYRALGLD
jgi:hypothetical protein